jgi:DNA-directed RNA polymerase subunit RPC12/RpoP
MFLKCVCNNCPGHIEFDEKDAGRTVACPHCGVETLLFVPTTNAPSPVTVSVASPSPASQPSGNSMKIRIWVYGLTLFGVIAFFIFGQIWKYNCEKETFSQFNQTLELDQMRLSTLEALNSWHGFQAVVAQSTDRDIDEDLGKQSEEKLKTEVENDHRRIEEFSRDHGF